MRIISEAGVNAASGSPVYVAHMASTSLSVGTYSIPRGGVDDQSPHAEDEIYVVMSGRSGFEGPWGQVPVGPGHVLYVPAGEEHRFVDVTEDLTLLVIFAPPYSGKGLSGPGLRGPVVSGPAV
jgi:mannose-6-phosphate isomerase-like protein (cupin superfamily)